MTIANFDKEIIQSAQSKGLMYFEQNAVLSVEESDYVWHAEVQGNEVYNIEVTLKDQNEIVGYNCNCPIGGGICKHIVATFYAIRLQMKSQRVQVKATNKNAFANLLLKISQNEFQGFITQYAAKNKDFKTEFELWFADKDPKIDVGKKYSEMIKKVIRKHSDHGFVDYRSSFSLSNEIENIIASGNEFVARKNYRDAFAIARPAIVELMATIEYSDDSNGNIGDAISSATELLGKIINAEAIAIDLHEQIFSFLRTELTNKIYFEYGDFGYELFPLFQALAVKLNYTNEFTAFIDAQCAALTGQYDNYRRDFFNTQKIAFLKAIGHTDEAEQLTHANMDIVEIREAEVEKLIHAKDYGAAKLMIEGGIKIAEQMGHCGTVSAWQRQLLRIAVLEKDIPGIRHYTKKFAFDNWSMDVGYYNQWKQTYNAEEWRTVIDAYILEKTEKINREHKNTKASVFFQPHVPVLDALGKVFIEEQYWDKILELLKNEKKVETVLAYHEHLAKRYPAEILEIYMPLLTELGNRVNTRSDYADLANKMKRIQKDIPGSKEQIHRLISVLKANNPRRPAMIQELNKVLI